MKPPLSQWTCTKSRLAVTAAVVLLIVLGYMVYTRNSVLSLKASELRVWWDHDRSVKFRIANENLRREAKKIIKENTVPSGCPGGGGYLPQNKDLKNFSEELLHIFFHDYLNNAEILCHGMLRMGKLGDGGWEVCNDETVRPPDNCLVYSFGINYDFSFDDMIAQHYGCEVHSFDPSMELSDSKRSEKVTFHHLGVYGKDTVLQGSWPVQSLSTIRRTLGHTARRLDVLKMDVEDSEWSTLETALADGSLNNVTQFLIEFHIVNKFDKNAYLYRLEILRKLRNFGFRIFYAHKNPQCIIGEAYESPRRTSCLEVHMIHIPQCKVR